MGWCGEPMHPGRLEGDADLIEGSRRDPPHRSRCQYLRRGELPEVVVKPGITASPCRGESATGLGFFHEGDTCVAHLREGQSGFTQSTPPIILRGINLINIKDRFPTPSCA